MSLQKLVFNTKEKTAKVYSSTMPNEIIFEYENIPTVKPLEGYYEIMQKIDSDSSLIKTVPVLRLPISNTNMVIEK